MASAVLQPSVDAIVRAIRDDNLYLDIEPTALADGQWQLWLDDKRGNGVQALVFPSREAATAFEAEVAVALKAAYAAEVAARKASKPAKPAAKGTPASKAAARSPATPKPTRKPAKPPAKSTPKPKPVRASAKSPKPKR